MIHKLLSTTAAVALAIAAAHGPAHAQVSADGGASVGASVGGGGVSAGGDAGVGASVGGGGVSAGADAGVGASVGGVGVSVDADVGIGTSGAVTGQALASVDASLIVGAPISISDGSIIGTVTDITTDSTGQVMITVDLAGELGVSLGSVRISAEYAVFVDQQVHLNITQASLVAALDAQSSAGVDAEANVDATIGGTDGITGGSTTTGGATTGTASPGAVDGIGNLANLGPGDLRSTLGSLSSADIQKLKLTCSEVLRNPAAYSADTRAVCEVIASI